MFLPFLGQEFSGAALICIGFSVGVLAGFFGMGGGWVVTPALYSLGFPMPFAIGTELANITGQSALATVKHRKMRNVDWMLGLWVGLSMMVGVEGGKHALMWTGRFGDADALVRWLYAVLLGVLGCYVLYDYFWPKLGSHATPNGPPKQKPLARLRVPPMLQLRVCGLEVSLWVLVGLGLAIGCMAGVMGCGGGFALVPAFVYLLGIPTVVAVGTSLVCVLLSGAYGTFTFGADGRVEVIAVMWLVLGSFVGTQFGTSAVRYVRGRGIRVLYGIMLILATVGVLLTQFEMRLAGGWAALGGAMVMCVIIIGRMCAVIASRRSETADGVS